MGIFFFQKYFKLFFAGFTISFLGALPIGSLNLTANEIYGTSGIIKTLIFIATLVCIELTVVLGLLKASSKLEAGKKYLPYVIPISVVLLVYLSYTCIFPNGDTTIHREGSLSSSLSRPMASPFTLGLVLGIGNPAQFPFWVGWNQWLSKRKILRKGRTWISVYLLGIGIGTFIGMALFVFLAHKLQVYMHGHYDLFSYLLGIFYLGLAFYMARLFHRFYIKPYYQTHVRNL